MGESPTLGKFKGKFWKEGVKEEKGKEEGKGKGEGLRGGKGKENQEKKRKTRKIVKGVEESLKFLNPLKFLWDVPKWK